MFKRISTLLGKAPGPEPPKKPPIKAPAKLLMTGTGYGAVAVTPGIRSCPAARGSVGKRQLFREAPRLPLAACTMPGDCSCRFKKLADRRDGERRQIGVTETGRWFSGPENRSRGRRKSSRES